MTKKYQWIVAVLVAILFLGLITNTIFPNKAPNLKVSSTKGEAMMIYDKNYKFIVSLSQYKSICRFDTKTI